MSFILKVIKHLKVKSYTFGLVRSKLLEKLMLKSKAVQESVGFGQETIKKNNKKKTCVDIIICELKTFYLCNIFIILKVFKNY